MGRGWSSGLSIHARTAAISGRKMNRIAEYSKEREVGTPKQTDRGARPGVLFKLDRKPETIPRIIERGTFEIARDLFQTRGWMLVFGP